MNPGSVPRSATGRCGLCGAELSGSLRLCAACDTPYHPGCWPAEGCPSPGCLHSPLRAQPVDIGDGLVGSSPGTRVKAVLAGGAVLTSLVVFSIPAPMTADAIRETVDVTAVTEQLHAPDVAKRVDAARYLGRVGSGAGEIVPRLVEALEDGVPAVRAAAASSLAAIGPAASSAVDALSRRSLDPDPDARLAIIHALGIVGRESDAAVAPLGRALSDPGRAIRAEAVRLLGMMRARARAAQPAVEALLAREADPAVSQAAVEALARIRG